MTTGELLAKAVEHHRAGRLTEAGGIYRNSLEARPTHPDANNLMAVLGRENGRFDDAIKLAKRAIESRPGVADYYFNLAEALRSAKRLEEALPVYAQALKLRPDDPEVCHATLASSFLCNRVR